ncbi:MAG: hypothetical protein Q8O09_00870 [Bacillota bacterium]|nr:hypothetical protein [Bacillota bacterium]
MSDFKTKLRAKGIANTMMAIGIIIMVAGLVIGVLLIISGIIAITGNIDLSELIPSNPLMPIDISGMLGALLQSIGPILIILGAFITVYALILGLVFVAFRYALTLLDHTQAKLEVVMENTSPAPPVSPEKPPLPEAPPSPPPPEGAGF